MISLLLSLEWLLSFFFSSSSYVRRKSLSVLIIIRLWNYLCMDLRHHTSVIHFHRKKKKKNESLDDLLVFCFFDVRSLNATDHLHENMQYSPHDDNNIDVKKKKLAFCFFFFVYFLLQQTDAIEWKSIFIR